MHRRTSYTRSSVTDQAELPQKDRTTPSRRRSTEYITVGWNMIVRYSYSREPTINWAAKSQEAITNRVAVDGWQYWRHSIVGSACRRFPWKVNCGNATPSTQNSVFFPNHFIEMELLIVALRLLADPHAAVTQWFFLPQLCTRKKKRRVIQVYRPTCV